MRNNGKPFRKIKAAAHQIWSRKNLGNASWPHVVVLEVTTTPWEPEEVCSVKIRSWDFMNNCEVGTTSYVEPDNFHERYGYVGMRLPELVPHETVLQRINSKTPQYTIVCEVVEYEEVCGAPLSKTKVSVRPCDKEDGMPIHGRTTHFSLGPTFYKKWKIVQSNPPKRRKDEKWVTMIGFGN
jgi:hypothetical protein